MKVALTFLIICLAMNLFLISIGCDRQQQQPKPKPVQEQPQTEVKKETNTRAELLEEYTSLSEKLDEIEKERLEGFMTPSESMTWLNNNHYQVQKKTDGNGYIITCNYYDPGPPSTHYDTRTEISGRGMASISGPTSALVTIDAPGQLRVTPSTTQQ